ncbi:hypothetical protein [Ancylobacter oerskovii]|uniref:Uncharacterized protein n=1 Tax=Ancylobacter oerskovii TaxID=459519 RepID=A0ABW4YRH3_9HYPH|nr:hypothetical protein [Ancylobacter oerskovii]MBS7545685.1 hypothetical protein [Ancylobacter oerskovii]
MNQSLEDMVAAVMAGDFRQFDQMTAEQVEKSKKARKEERQERERVAACFSRLAATDDGRAALNWIVARTLRRVTFFVQPGMSPGQVALMGAKREGMNELAFEILRLVAEGHGETLPPRT